MNRETSKTTLTRREHLQLLGIEALLHRYGRQVNELEAAAREILGVPDDDITSGVEELIYADSDVDAILDRLGVVVVDESAPARGEA